MSGKKLLPNGKRVYNNVGTHSKTSASKKDRALHKLLMKVYAKLQRMDNPATNAASRRDFVFHMTDWKHDLECLAELYKHPEKFDGKAAAILVASFLYHASSHIRAAARLSLDWEPEDIFK